MSSDSFTDVNLYVNFKQPGKTLRELKIILVGFFLSLGCGRIGVWQNPEDNKWLTKLKQVAQRSWERPNPGSVQG